MTTDTDLQVVLRDLLSLAHQQVQFAEAKNGALLTLNFALIVGIVAVSRDSLVWQWKAYMFTVAASIGLAGLMAVVSFMPRLSPIKDVSSASSGNVAFTGDIAKMGAAVFLLDLMKKLGTSVKPSGYCIDLADQVYVNARIAATKFRWFQLAAIITVLGLVLPSVWLAYELAFGCLELWS